jgi:hypothetical protein
MHIAVTVFITVLFSTKEVISGAEQAEMERQHLGDEAMRLQAASTKVRHARNPHLSHCASPRAGGG